MANYNPYHAFCRKACGDAAVFATFRKASEYVQMLEHVTVSQAEAYLARVSSHLLNTLNLEKWRENDTVGAPYVFSFSEVGVFSPTTLRYLKQLSDIERLFGTSAQSISEVGVGYGGLARMLLAHFSQVRTYTLIDLEGAIALASRYLEKFEESRGRVKFVDTARHLRGQGSEPRDLFISNYAMTELSQPYLDHYLAFAARHPRGYVSVNAAQEYVVDALRTLKPQRIEEPPALSANGRFFILAWGM